MNQQVNYHGLLHHSPIIVDFLQSVAQLMMTDYELLNSILDRSNGKIIVPFFVTRHSVTFLQNFVV